MKVKLHKNGKTQELIDFVSGVKLTEAFGYDAPFTAKSKGNLKFVNVFRLDDTPFAKGLLIPRFIHILLGDDVKRSKVAVELMEQAEDYLKLLGYNTTFAYINKNNRLMSVLAQKFGYKKDTEDDKAFYYFKEIGG